MLNALYMLAAFSHRVILFRQLLQLVNKIVFAILNIGTAII
uniref:Uncharacterized protein n=1 Tax=Arundo donax TaxID=35708 RepID=A0A0A8Y7S1_ARUDO